MKGNKIILPVFTKEENAPVGVACIPYQYILDQTPFGYIKNEKMEVDFYAHDEECAIHASSDIDAECSCEAILNFSTDYQVWNDRSMPVVVADTMMEAQALIEDTHYLVKRTNNIYFMK